MKKLILIFAPFVMVSIVEARQIVLDVPDRDISIVELDVTDAEQWIRDAWAGKLNNCKSRAIRKEIDLSIQDKTAIPSDVNQILDKHLSRPKVDRTDIQ